MTPRDAGHGTDAVSSRFHRGPSALRRSGKRPSPSPLTSRVARGGKDDRKAVHGLTIFLAVVLGMGPTVGDIGSCGQDIDALDAPTFFELKARIDCSRCSECTLSGKQCEAACISPPATAFAPGCHPLVHDGEVCLHALLHAPCDDYATYVDENHPAAPSECQFCPVP